MARKCPSCIRKCGQADSLTAAELSPAEERLVEAEAHAVDVTAVLAAGGMALPEPFAGRVELGLRTLYVTSGPEGFRYRCSSSRALLSLSRAEAIEAIAEWMEGLS